MAAAATQPQAGGFPDNPPCFIPLLSARGEWEADHKVNMLVNPPRPVTGAATSIQAPDYQLETLRRLGPRGAAVYPSSQL